MDHVPPKGVFAPTQMRLDKLSECFNRNEDELHEVRPVMKSQNGIKFPTICARCNNGLLGAKFDPALIHFSNEIIRFHSETKGMYARDVANIRAQPHKIMRAVLGHLSAVGTDRYRKGPHTEAVRDYLLNEQLALPTALKIYYWIYPNKEQVLIRDLCIS